MRTSVSVFTLVALLSLVFSSCGGSNSKTEEQEVTQEVKQKKVSAEELGEKINESYSNALTELVELLKETPDAAEAGPKIEVLKEKYIQEFVALGKAREEMDEAEKSKVDLTIRIGLQNIYSDPVYTNYAEVINNYLTDSDTYKKLTDFNIITQYANFELLKQQEPEEAQRLGIE